MNPFLGVLLHGIGGFFHGSFYFPLTKVKGWAWEQPLWGFMILPAVASTWLLLFSLVIYLASLLKSG